MLLRKSLLGISAVLLAFFLHGLLHLEVATMALFGAAALVLYAKSDVEKVLCDVEGPALLFFVGLFVLVGGLEVTGVMARVAELLATFDGSSAIMAVAIIWGSAAASGIVDTILFTATRIPVIRELTQAQGHSLVGRYLISSAYLSDLAPPTSLQVTRRHQWSPPSG